MHVYIDQSSFFVNEKDYFEHSKTFSENIVKKWLINVQLSTFLSQSLAWLAGLLRQYTYLPNSATIVAWTNNLNILLDVVEVTRIDI